MPCLVLQLLLYVYQWIKGCTNPYGSLPPPHPPGKFSYFEYNCIREVSGNRLYHSIKHFLGTFSHILSCSYLVFHANYFLNSHVFHFHHAEKDFFVCLHDIHLKEIHTLRYGPIKLKGTCLYAVVTIVIL